MTDDALAQTAAKALRIDDGDALSHCRPVPEIDGLYVWDPSRGGRSVLVSRDGGRLVAASAVGFERHLSDYLKGRRN